MKNVIFLLSFFTFCAYSVEAQRVVVEKTIGEAHSQGVSGGQESFHAVQILADGRILAAGYRIPACAPKTEKVEGSYWEKVVKSCPEEIKQMYLVLLDTSANVLRTKTWGDSTVHTRISHVLPLKNGGYLTVGEKGDDKCDDLVLSLFDKNDSLTAEKIFTVKRDYVEMVVEKISLTPQNQIVVMLSAKWGAGNKDYSLQTFDMQLKRLSNKPTKVAQAKVNPLADFWARGGTIREEDVAKLQFSDKSVARLYNTGNFKLPITEIRLQKNGQPKPKTTKFTDVFGKAMAADKYGNIWIVGTKQANTFDADAWIVRYRRTSK